MNKERRHSEARVLATIVAALTILAAASAGGQNCQTPLFIKQYGADANIMFLCDNSGSMNEAIWHDAYNPNVTYSGNFSSETMYYVSSAGNKTPRSFNSHWPSTPSAYLVNSDSGEDGRYVGNYLNWVYFHATSTQRSAIPRQTRVQVLKPTINNIVQHAASMRFGVTIFRTEGPGNIICTMTTNKTTITNAVSGIDANAWTPLGESEETILNYFASSSAGAPIQASCQRNFLVICTDGFPTHDLDVSSYLRDADGDHLDPGNCASIGSYSSGDEQCSHYMDDVVYYMAHHDLRSDLDGDQTITTYVIGFTVSSALLQHTASNGGGLYYTANNAAGLANAFSRVMQDILMRLSSGSAVAVVSSEHGDIDRMYRGKFMPGTWQGFLEAYSVPYAADDLPLWESGSLLNDREPDDRTIYTALGATRYAFTTTNAGTLRAQMGVSTVDSASTYITWTRGEDVTGLRDRSGWRLGDIVNSTPVIVGAPAGYALEDDYQSYLTTLAEREKVIYIGANDGMLHCFSAADGQENWAFVPQFSLPKLKVMADTMYCHTYTCDQTPSVADLKLGGNWRTVLVEGEREGGCSYFALDITDASDPTVLWQTTLPDGYAFSSETEFARIGDTAVALIGSGLNAVNGRSYIYAYRVSDGTLLGSVQLGTVSGGRNKATRPRAVDTNMDGKTDLVYVADMTGCVWRLAVGTSLTPSSWSKSTLFSGSQAITAAPTTAYGGGTKIYVYFGTGAYLDDTDFGTSTQQRFYCVYDRQDGSTHSPSDMQDQTTTIHTIGSGAGGWYVNLWGGTGERVTEQAAIVAGAVLFASFTPVMTMCESGGHSYLYRLAFDNGGTVKDKEGNNTPRQEDLGGGVASRPVVDLSHANVIIQSSDAAIHIRDIGAPFQNLNVKAWQENFDHVVGATYHAQ